jgi:hypothetical protein
VYCKLQNVTSHDLWDLGGSWNKGEYLRCATIKK